MRSVTQGRFRLLLDYHRLPSPEGDAVADGPATIRTGASVAEHYLAAQDLGVIPRDREAFCILLLNARHRPLALHVVSIGSLASAPCHPREVFRPAIAVGAHALILAHHHPTGDCSPSHEDRTVTKRMQDAGELLGIQVLDHVVLGASRFYSFSDGRMSNLPTIQHRRDRP